MRYILVIFFFYSSSLHSQENSRYGIDWVGASIPDFSYQVRARYLLNRIEFNVGLDLNAVNTLGRIVGLKMSIKKWEKTEEKVNSIVAGLDYDFTTSGIFSYGEGNGATGSFFINKSHFLVPSIGFRFYSRSIFLNPSIIKDHSFTFGLLYKIPLTDNVINHRDGFYDDNANKFASGYVKGGLNAFVRLTFWMGK